MNWPADDECSSSASGGMGGMEIVNVSDMQGSFFILFIGCLLGLIAFVVECIRWDRQGRVEMETETQVIKPVEAWKEN